MKKGKLVFQLVTGVQLAGILVAQATTPAQPNVIYVFPDQMRNHAMNFWNTAEFRGAVNFTADPVHTPNIDRFAKESVVLSSAQSCYPLSSPYRGMFLTGMYPEKSGITLNCNSNRPNSSLNINAETIGDVFSKNGYDCAYIGKYHADFPTKNNPQALGQYVENRIPAWDAYTPAEARHGFNYWYSYGTYDVHKKPHYWDTNGERHEIREWSPKHEVDKVIEYLREDRAKDKPFFLIWAANPPHAPYGSLNDCMEEDYDLYKDTPLNQLLVRPNINPKLVEKQAKAPYYFASVTGVDREFGRILAELERQGLTDNTIVIFTSDHGETMASHVEDPKNSPYAEAMNVPFIIRYPEKLKPKVSSILLAPVDIMPTMLSLAGLESKIPEEVQGRDLSEFWLTDNPKSKAPEGVLYMSYGAGDKDKEGNVITAFPMARGIKTHKYTLSIKIDKKQQIQQILFFDDEKDPYQMKSLSIDEYKTEFNKLCTQMATLLKNANDPWYTQKILGDIIPYDNIKSNKNETLQLQ